MNRHGDITIDAEVSVKLRPLLTVDGAPTKEQKLEQAYTLLADALAVKSTSTGTRPIPSGVTYLAQMMAHDLVLTVPTGIPRRPFENLIGRPLLLDSLYGLGPGSAPHLYMKEDNGSFRTRFCENKISSVLAPAEFSPDVFRNNTETEQISKSEAILGDRRNDSHTFIAQLTAVWMRFHNLIVNELDGGTTSATARQTIFISAQRITRATWHNVLRNDVLKFVIGEDFIADQDSRLDQNSGAIRLLEVPGGAHIALRALHSLPLPQYLFNSQSSKSRDIGKMIQIGSELPNKIPHSIWRIEWPLFFEIKGCPEPINKTRYEPLFASELVKQNGTRIFLADLARSLRIPKFNVGHAQLELLQSKYAKTLLEFIREKMSTVSATDEEKAIAIGVVAENLPIQLLILEEARSLQQGGHLGPHGAALLAPWLMRSLRWAEQHNTIEENRRHFVKENFEQVLTAIGQLEGEST